MPTHAHRQCVAVLALLLLHCSTNVILDMTPMFLSCSYMLRTSEHRVLLTRASRRLLEMFMFRWFHVCVRVCSCVVLGIFKREHYCWEGRLRLWKQNSLRKHLFREEMSKEMSCFLFLHRHTLSNTHQYTQTRRTRTDYKLKHTHTHSPLLRQKEGGSEMMGSLQVVDDIKGVLFLGGRREESLDRTLFTDENYTRGMKNRWMESLASWIMERSR